MPVITINGVSFDPGAKHVLAENLISTVDASTSDYILIQTTLPLTKEQKAELNNKGVQILEYVPEDTYLCNYKETDLSVIRSLPYITWVNVYMEGFKIAPSLKFNEPKPGNRTMAEVLSQPSKAFSRTPKLVDVVFHKGAGTDKLRQEIAIAAHIDAEDIQLSNSKIRVSVQLRYLSAIAAIDEVHHIEEVTPYKLHNHIARQIVNAGIPNPAGIYAGKDQVIAVADTGFDMGSTTNVHPAFTGRVVKLYSLGRPNKTNDPDSHGTHVAGSVLGNGASAILGVNVTGTAPEAKLVLQSVLDAQGGLGGLPADLHDLFIKPYQNDGARVHSNSWGSNTADGSYDSNSGDVDKFVWDNRDMVICFAAGNEAKDDTGTGRVSNGSLTPPGTAKNCITVGATENNRPNFPLTYGKGWPDNFPAPPVSSDKVADNIEGMVAFSSRGPTKDHRIKPDVVAPGTYVLSTLSRAVKAADPGWGKSADPLYFFDGGTSMATPLVAGCAALVREFLIKTQHIAKPSAALVKALLINGATDIKGQYTLSEAGTIPNTAEGFGRVNIKDSTGPFAANQLLVLKDENKELDTNEEEQTTLQIPANAKLLKVTLVWTDPPGEKLQNDLDLIVKVSNGKEAHGNVDLTSASFDRDNNVEQVMWPGVPTGAFTVTVRAFRAAQATQSYALVIRTDS